MRGCVRLERTERYIRRGGHRHRCRRRTSTALRAARLVALDGGGGVGVLGHSARRHAEREREQKQTNTDGGGYHSSCFAHGTNISTPIRVPAVRRRTSLSVHHANKGNVYVYVTHGAGKEKRKMKTSIEGMTRRNRIRCAYSGPLHPRASASFLSCPVLSVPHSICISASASHQEPRPSRSGSPRAYRATWICAPITYNTMTMTILSTRYIVILLYVLT